MNLLSVKEVLPQNERGIGRIAALCGGFLLSFDPVFIRFSGTSGVDTAFLFGVFSAFSMAVLIQIRDKRGLFRTLLDGGWPLVLSALLILGSASTFVLSIKHTTVANTVLILSARPILTALASWIFLREKTSKSLGWAILGVLGGVYIVVYGNLGGGSLLGDGLAMMTVIFLGLNGTLWRRYKEISRLAVVGLGGFFVALVMFIPSNPSSFSVSTWLIMGAMGLLSAPLGRVLNATASRYIPSTEMATLTLISAVLAPVWAFLFFQEKPPPTTLAGGALILISIMSYILLTGSKFGNRTTLFKKRSKENVL